MPARSIDTASISFGLVAIPVKVFSSNEPSHEVHFHMIHAGCGERVHQQLVCPTHGVVTRDQIAKGYEPTKGNTIQLDPKELVALDAVANDEISIREFVPAATVDPIYVDATYYLGPAKGGNKAYRLLRDALEATDLFAIASYAARGKSYIVAVRPYENGLAMHQLRYADEIKPWKAIELGELPKPTGAELQLAKTLIDQLRADAFDATRYKDEVKDRVRALLADKVKHGETITTPEAAAKPAKVTDLMAALKASLGSGSAAHAAKPRHGGTPRHPRTAAAPRHAATRARTGHKPSPAHAKSPRARAASRA